MQRFIAVAAEFNVLNVVAVKALAQQGDEVIVLADPHAQALHWHDRLARVIEAGLISMTVRTLSMDHASAVSLRRASEEATAAFAPGQPPGVVYLLAIGGRKHDMLLLKEMLRRGCQAVRAELQTVSVARRPFRLRTSRLGAGNLDWHVVHLASAGSHAPGPA